ncbi:MAG: BadF/BadG/BcrA/BcrD ATPase family protein [Candidatus Merdivicinus sp.]|jgi:N-acetylglucosamine kinase-like BadF-type ATPase
MQGYYFSLDSGGSKIQIELYDSKMYRMDTVTLSDGNPTYRDKTEILQNILLAFEQLIQQHNITNQQILAVVGVVMIWKCTDIETELQKRYPKAKIAFYSEKEVNHFCAFGDRDGYILHSGTGSYVYGQFSGKFYEYGGLGSFLGDEGSGFWIGVQGIQAVIAAIDGRGSPTQMTDLLFSHWQISQSERCFDTVWKVIHGLTVYSIEAKRKCADFCKIVCFAAENGDFVALHIVHSAAEELFRYFKALIIQEHLPEHAEYSISGGVLTHCSILRDQLIYQIHTTFPHLQYIPTKYEPCYAAIYRYLKL